MDFICVHVLPKGQLKTPSVSFVASTYRCLIGTLDPSGIVCFVDYLVTDKIDVDNVRVINKYDHCYQVPQCLRDWAHKMTSMSFPLTMSVEYYNANNDPACWSCSVSLAEPLKLDLNCATRTMFRVTPIDCGKLFRTVPPLRGWIPMYVDEEEYIRSNSSDEVMSG